MASRNPYSRFVGGVYGKKPDLLAVKELAESGRLSLDGLITHDATPTQADTAYRTDFGDSGCLKMVLDWRQCQ